MARGQGCSNGRNAATPRSLARPTPVAWDRLAGPEATDAELDTLWFWFSSAEGDRKRAELRDFLDGSSTESYCGEGAPRRALEAVLAAAEGVPAADWKAANAARPWIELYEETQVETEAARAAGVALPRLAVAIEIAQRKREQGQERPDAAAISPELAEFLVTVGPGQRSGRLTDYTRAELCKLLHFRQRDAARFTDDDLRAMALDAHAVPRWPCSPSHAELAALWAGHENWPWKQPATTKSCLNENYGELLARTGGVGDDDGTLDHAALEARLAETQPLVAAAGLSHEALLHFCKQNKIRTRYPARAAYTAASEQRLVSALDARYADAFQGFVGSFGGGTLRGVVGHGSDGGWAKTLAAKGMKGHRRARKATADRPALPATQVLAFYDREGGQVHLHPDFDALIARAERGTATPVEVYEASETLAHELLHAASGSNGGYRRGTAGETIEEGAVETLARLHADALARDMGLWDKVESLRQTVRTPSEDAPSYRDVAYPDEVRAMVMTAAACVGEMTDMELFMHAFQHPEELSERGRTFLTELHTTVPLAQRPQVIAETLQARYGGDADAIRETLDRLYELPAQDRVGWERHETGDDEDEQATGWIETGQSYAGAMCNAFAYLLLGQTPA